MLIRSLVSIFAAPPGLNLLLICLGLVVMARLRRTGLSLCLLGVVSLWLFATPFVSTLLSRTLEAYPVIEVADIPTDKKVAMVVLGAAHLDNAEEYGSSTPTDHGLVRLHYAASLHRRTGLPIMLTGGPANASQDIHSEVLANSLEQQFGITPAWLERESSTTWQNATNSAEILLPQGFDTVVLVTEAYHMRRAAMLYEWAGFNVLPAPTLLEPLFPWNDWKFWMPEANALERSALVVHETLGLLWYRLVSPIDSQFENEVTLTR